MFNEKKIVFSRINNFVKFYKCKFFECKSIEFISLKNQECKIRPQVININSNYPIFYPFSIKINKCSDNCNNNNNPYAKICVPDVIEDSNVKVFN